MFFEEYGGNQNEVIDIKDDKEGKRNTRMIDKFFPVDGPVVVLGKKQREAEEQSPAYCVDDEFQQKVFVVSDMHPIRLNKNKDTIF